MKTYSNPANDTITLAEMLSARRDWEKKVVDPSEQLAKRLIEIFILNFGKIAIDLADSGHSSLQDPEDEGDEEVAFLYSDGLYRYRFSRVEAGYFLITLH